MLPLVGDFDGQLHARMDGANHHDVAALVEADWGRGAWCLRAEIEFAARSERHGVVRYRVVVDEGKGFALLDRHRDFRESTGFLMDDRVVGQGRDGGYRDQRQGTGEESLA